jgi:hypothetical protein
MDTEINSLRLASDVRYRVIGGEAVVVCQNTAEVLVLNALGARILGLLEKGRVPDEIRTTLLNEYDVEESKLNDDLDTYLKELLEAGVITRNG